MTNPSYGKCYPFDSASGQQAGSAEWRVLASAWGDGIAGDNRGTVGSGGDGQSSFGLATSAGSRGITLFNLGSYRVRGIMFEATQDSLTLPALPAPTAGQVQAHLVVAELNPTLKQITFKTVSGTAQASGVPPRPGLLRVAGGVWQDPLWMLYGDNGASSTLTRVDYRHWIGATYAVWDVAALNPMGSSVPIGSRAYVMGTGEEYLLRSSNSVLEWINLSNPDWAPLNTGSTINGTSQYRVAAGRVELRGQATKVTGSWAAGDYTLATLPTGLWPKDQRGNVVCGPVSSTGGLQSVVTWVNTSGQVRFRVPTGTTLSSFWIDAISYAQEA